MPFPSFAEVVSSYSAMGVAKEATFRTSVPATAFTPFDACTIEEDPAVFSPQTMIGVTSTDIYALQGEVKVDGNIKSPLYATNGIPLLIGAIGQDAIAHSGISGAAKLCSAGTPGNSTCATLNAIGAVSLTVASGTGFAINQVIVLEPGTANAEVVAITGAVVGATLPITATAKAHDGTTVPFTVQTCGAIAAAGAVAAGSSAVTLTAGLGALFTSNDIVQYDVNGTTSTSEVRKVTKTTDTLTVADSTPYNAWTFAHAAAAWVIFVGAGPYTHQVDAGALDSFTIEKNVGGVQSVVYPGCRMSKGSLSVPSGQAAANLQIDAMGAGVPVVQAIPTQASTTTEAPFIFAEASLQVLGGAHPECYNAKIDWDNVLKPTWTFSGDHHASFLTKTNLHVSGSFDAIFHNFNDANDGFWSKAHNFAGGSLVLTLAHADGSSIVITIPSIRLKKAPQTLTVGAVVVQPITFMGFYGLATATPNIRVQITSTQRYLPW